MTTTNDIDIATDTWDLTGSAYGAKPAESTESLVRVGPGTPYGEVLRRYWQPVALASDATSTPKRLRILGEDLILFRTNSGEPGLLTPGCAHRGASLFFGGVEDDGIRCCYHGWKFDPQGRVLDQPCEPDGGRHRDRIRQPWYPLRDYHGLLFAYLGPPDKIPSFPIYDVLENAGPDERIHADDSSYGGGGPRVLDFNWLQHWENVLDPFHVPILHARFSGNQFVEEMGIIPECGFAYTDQGVRCQATRTLSDGRVLLRIEDDVFPNIRLVGSPLLNQLGPTNIVGWVLPYDDTHFVLFSLVRIGKSDAPFMARSRQAGKLWPEMTDDEHQRFPGDYEAQRSQGSIAVHSRENLTTTDQGVTMLRRMMGKQIKRVSDGLDPAGVVRGPAEVTYTVEAGTYFVDDNGK